MCKLVRCERKELVCCKLELSRPLVVIMYLKQILLFDQIAVGDFVMID